MENETTLDPEIGARLTTWLNIIIDFVSAPTSFVFSPDIACAWSEVGVWCTPLDNTFAICYQCPLSVPDEEDSKCNAIVCLHATNPDRARFLQQCVMYLGLMRDRYPYLDCWNRLDHNGP